MKAPADADFRKHLFEANTLWQRVAGKTAFNITTPYGLYPKEQKELATLLADKPAKAVDAVFAELSRLDNSTFRYRNLVAEFAEIEKACVTFENQFVTAPDQEPVEDYIEFCVAGLNSTDEGLYIKDLLHRLIRPKYAREIIHFQQVDRFSLWPVKDIDKVVRQIKFGEIVKKQGREVLVEAYPIDPARLQAWKKTYQETPLPNSAPVSAANRSPVFAALTQEQLAAMPFFQLGFGVPGTAANVPGLADAGRMREMATTSLPQSGPSLIPQSGPLPSVAGRPQVSSGPVITKYYSETRGQIPPDPPIPADADDLTRGLAMSDSQNPHTRRLGFDLLKTADIKGRDEMLLERMKKNLETPLNTHARDAATIIARCNSPSTVKVLCDSLANPHVNGEIINLLAAKKDPESFRPLADTMEHDLQKRIDPVLISFGPAAEDAVLARLEAEGTRRDVSRRCCNILATIGTAKSLPTLNKFARSPEETLYKAAASDAVDAINSRIR